MSNNTILHLSFCIVIVLLLVIITTSISVIGIGLKSSLIASAQHQQRSLSNQTTAFDIGKPIKDLSFEIDNMTFSHHTAYVNGIRMHYVIGGHGNPVFLLHGWPETWYEWRHVMPALAKNYTVIAPDLRGLGDSSKPVTGYDGDTTAQDIYQLVTQLRLDQKINLVGHDIGVNTAYSYAAAHPNNVSKLVILEGPVPGFYPPGFKDCCWWFSFHQTPDMPEVPSYLLLSIPEITNLRIHRDVVKE